jgi:hypothetical protein
MILTANNANAFASTFYFLQRSMPTQKKIKRACKQPHTTVQTFVQTLTDIALNVNRSYKVSANLKRNRFVEREAHAHNIRLKEIKKRRALRGKQRVVVLTNGVSKRTVMLLNPSFFYFFNPFFVSGNSLAVVQH